MSSRTGISWVTWTLTVTIGLASIARADSPTTTTDKETVALKLGPAAPSAAGLGPRLIYLPTEQTSGNAALAYLKAMLKLRMYGPTYDELQVVNWLNQPIDEFPREKARKLLGGFDSVMYSCRQGACRSECDWGSPVLSEDNWYGVDLSEAQAARGLGRIIALKARLSIADGRWDDALDELRIGFALSRHIGEQPTLVSGLIGMSIAQMMIDQIEAWQMKSDRNLYWALIELPQPLIDLKPAAEIESRGVFLTFPQLAQVRDARWGEEQWASELNQFRRQWFALAKAFGEPRLPGSDTDDQVDAGATYAREQLPKYRYDAKQVAAMSPAEAVLRYVAARSEAQSDELLRIWHLPPNQGLARARSVADEFRSRGDEPLVLQRLDVGRTMLPVLAPCIEKMMRFERRLTAEVAIEAIRSYAARHSALPAQLDDIRELPVPLDPATHEPFAYKLEGNAATLSLPSLMKDKPSYEYRLSLAGGK